MPRVTRRKHLPRILHHSRHATPTLRKLSRKLRGMYHASVVRPYKSAAGVLLGVGLISGAWMWYHFKR